MPSSPTTKAAAAFVCDCTERMRSACDGLPFYKKREGKRYCVLHYPGEDKSADFDEALQRKLEAEDFDFRGVWLPDEVDFRERIFAGPVIFDYATFNALASFDYATFSAKTSFAFATFRALASFIYATFSEQVCFDAATFSAGANFRGVAFDAGAGFISTTFSARASFDSATFSARASFNSATFSAGADFQHARFRAGASFFYTTFSAEASFRQATFRAEVNFGSATFKDYVRFAGRDEVPVFGDESSLKLQFARIEKPERFSFHTLTLSPHWFVNVDARKFEFINVKWNWYGRQIRRKLGDLRGENALPSYHLMEIACRNLALNAEEN
ncbi:MAG TPA: pentapeptide repeat-containing protein, partial [Pyrinomonadaceae bacterium]